MCHHTLAKYTYRSRQKSSENTVFDVKELNQTHAKVYVEMQCKVIVFFENVQMTPLNIIIV
jgi:hypothetical protein